MSKNTCGDYADPAKQYQKICGGASRSLKQKKVGGTMQYPFQTEFHNYPVPNKVDFKVENATNMIKDVDMFGCKGTLDANIFVNPKLVGGKKSSDVNRKFSGGMSRSNEQPLDAKRKFSGGDCGCVSSTMKLGGTIEQQNMKKHTGAGYGYTFNIPDAIGNRPEVDRYPTDSQCAGGKSKQNKYLVEISKQHPNHSSKNVGMGSNQKGGSAASDSLMNYFLDFQHRCRSSEIY